MKAKAELIVATALRDCARELVAVAKSPSVVDAANDEWKRQNKRIERLEAEIGYAASAQHSEASAA